MNLADLRPRGVVMVVDDEPRMRELLVRALTQWGLTVSAARSGEEALRMAEANGPEIVVLDLNLPGIDGLECFARLREKLPRVQAIVLTGFASVESAQQAVHLEVVEFLTKPCHLGELERAIDRAMRRLMPAKGSSAAPEPNSHAAVEAKSVTLEEMEREHILTVLERHQGNRTAAAAALGISRRTLYYKLEEYQRQGHAAR
jgi:two-component system response regulator RegA